MFSISQLNEIQVIAFGLILLRMSGFIFTAAILNSNNVSAPLKVLLSLVLTFSVFNSIANNTLLVQLSTMQDQLLLLSVKEIFLGVVLGFVTRVFFFSVMMAGELISVNMGLGQAQIFNPLMGNMGNVFEQFFVSLATLLYMGINGHHSLIESLVNSFDFIKLTSLDVHAISFFHVAEAAQQFFVFGIKIAAPILVSMLVIQVGVGLLSRAVPQINVLMTSAPITVMIGFGVLFISLPLMVMQMSGLLDASTSELFKFIKEF